eukprot:TRINITY_DN51597_c0_g1_i1.p1 TRINITY_DN51597_c0_g1~~TRINITY_DN51597_c0_g1_i1.p1  ORF type:complete len:208 (-),score=31.96 TRINITY_DN51597_c0_g1_i1:16-639(-)
MGPEPKEACSSMVSEGTSETSVASAGCEFIVRINKTDQKLGMKLDISAPSHTIVFSVEDGLIAEWNKQNPDLAVLVHDQLVKVNGEDGEGKAFEEKLAEASGVLELTFKRPVQSTFTLKKDGKSLGLVLRMIAGSMALGITAIKDEGAWKACEGVEHVHVNDRIVMVNGVRDAAEKLLEAIKTQESMDLCVCCYSVPADELLEFFTV